QFLVYKFFEELDSVSEVLIFVSVLLRENFNHLFHGRSLRSLCVPTLANELAQSLRTIFGNLRPLSFQNV
ncbi:hypothetical protein PpSQ1_27295, partial [Pseudomonas putida]